MTRAIRFEDDRPKDVPPFTPSDHFRKIRVDVSIHREGRQSGGTCYPKNLDDDVTVGEKILWVDEGHNGTLHGIFLQVHLERDGITAWAQGGKFETFRDVANRAARIWWAAKQRWEFEHKNILP